MTQADARRALRGQMRLQRQALTVPIRLAAAEAVAQSLLPLDAMRRPGRVAGYWAVQGEVPLHALFAAPAPYDYCLPCVVDGARLGFAPWRPGEPVEPNRYGIPEPIVAPEHHWPPESLDVVLVPLLAFDRRGGRLGSGAGYYDRSFAFLAGLPRPARPLLVGIGYAMQEVEQLPLEPWDIALDFVATEAGLLDCHAV